MTTISRSDVMRERMLRLTRDLELPDSWKPPLVMPVTLPERRSNDYAELAAWYGPFGMFDHVRRLCLSNCREVLRAKYAAAGERITEKQLDDEAHRHEAYVGFLRDHLDGRILYFRERQKMGFGD